jgi:hypothetical protein
MTAHGSETFLVGTRDASCNRRNERQDTDYKGCELGKATRGYMAAKVVGWGKSPCLFIPRSECSIHFLDL